MRCGPINTGMTFRSIDWNVTARYNHPYVKIFEEERGVDRDVVD